MRVVVMGERIERIKILECGLREAGYTIAARLSNGTGLVQEVIRARAELVVMETDHPAASTLSLVRDLVLKYPCPVVLFTQHSDARGSSAALKAGVSAYIVDGLESKRIKAIMEIAIARFEETRALQIELERVSTSLQERKLIERAKGILMRRVHIEEDAAYKTLRKMAMDRNKRIADVAESIITAEEFLVQGVRPGEMPNITQ